MSSMTGTSTTDMTWSNQVYYHHDTGRGIVAGPVNQAGLPGLFAIYYPQLVVGGSTSSAGTLANIVNVFGGTGYEVRTTEYRINRGGERSTLNWQLGDHRSRPASGTSTMTRPRRGAGIPSRPPTTI